MPWLVSILMIGTVIGAPAITATRKSVIFSAEGSDDRLTFDWTKEEAASAAAFPFSAIAPAAVRPSVLKNERRPAPLGDSSSSFCATAFILDPPQNESSDLQRNRRQPLPTSSRRTGERETSGVEISAFSLSLFLLF